MTSSPRSMAKSFLFWRAYHAHVEKHGEEPTKRDMADALGWNPGAVHYYSGKHPNLPLRPTWRDSRSCVESLDSYIRRNTDTDLGWYPEEV